MKKLYILLFTILITSLSFGQLINEFEPNPNGTDPGMVSVELKGTPSAGFSGVILSIESDLGGSQGLVDRFTAVSGTFDANGLLVVMIPDLENPSLTLVLVSTFSGDNTTDIDTNDDGVVDDISTFGVIYDAIGTPDIVGDEASIYGVELGGSDFAYTGDEPRLIFRDGDTDDLYAVNDTSDGASDEVYDVTATLIPNADFDVNPAAANTFGTKNPVYSPSLIPTITITSPADFAVFSDGTTSVNIDFATTNLGAGDQVDITVTKNAGSPTTTTDVMSSPFVIMGTAAGDTYEVTAEVVNGGSQIDFETIDFSIAVAPVCANAGDIIFTEILQNPSFSLGVNDSEGEWFELYNTTGSPIDLGGWSIIDDSVPTEMFIIPSSLVIPAGGYLLFANNNDTMTNGGLPTPDFVYVNGFPFLGNGTDGITLQCPLATIIDQVIWDDGATFPDPDGSSMSLHIDYLTDGTPETFNDSGSNWETITSTYGVGQNGTPGLANNDFSLTANDFETNSFKIYPNPTSLGYVNISSKNGETIKASVFDILGKQVINTTVSNNRLDVSNLNTGIYIMRITQNNATVTKKLVIQ